MVSLTFSPDAGATLSVAAQALVRRTVCVNGEPPSRPDVWGPDDRFVCAVNESGLWVLDRPVFPGEDVGDEQWSLIAWAEVQRVHVY